MEAETFFHKRHPDGARQRARDVSDAPACLAPDPYDVWSNGPRCATHLSHDAVTGCTKFQLNGFTREEAAFVRRGMMELVPVLAVTRVDVSGELSETAPEYQRVFRQLSIQMLRHGRVQEPPVDTDSALYQFVFTADLVAQVGERLEVTAADFQLQQTEAQKEMHLSARVVHGETEYMERFMGEMLGVDAYSGPPLFFVPAGGSLHARLLVRPVRDLTEDCRAPPFSVTLRSVARGVRVREESTAEERRGAYEACPTQVFEREDLEDLDPSRCVNCGKCTELGVADVDLHSNRWVLDVYPSRAVDTVGALRNVLEALCWLLKNDCFREVTEFYRSLQYVEGAQGKAGATQYCPREVECYTSSSSNP